MTAFAIVYGLLMIGIGFMVKKYPDTISGYSTLPTQEKEKVDINGLSSMIKTSMIITGCITSSLYLIFNYFNQSLLCVLALILPFLISALIMINLAPLHGFNANKKLHIFIPNILIPTFIIGFTFNLIQTNNPTITTISDDAICFSGAYGYDLPLYEISDIDLKANLPKIETRTNGFSLGKIKKGKFVLQNYGVCNLFLQENHGPYLVIIDKDGDKTIVNMPDSLETEQFYYKLRRMIDE